MGWKVYTMTSSYVDLFSSCGIQEDVCDNKEDYGDQGENVGYPMYNRSLFTHSHTRVIWGGECCIIRRNKSIIAL